MKLNIFKNKKPNKAKLEKFGFKKTSEGYFYSLDVFDRQFRFDIVIGENNKINTKMIDKQSNELYVLHLISSSEGSFVGKIREEYETILEKICRECFENDIFKTNQAREIIEFIKKEYNDNLEYLWEKFPDNAIARRKDNKKWYFLIMTVSEEKIKGKGKNKIEVIDLRMLPSEKNDLIDNKNYFTGYHMNKNHWFTICLDDNIATKEIFKRIKISYDLAKK